MLKKTKKILIRRKIREVVEIQKNERIIAYCENCLDEQSFKIIDVNATNHSMEATEVKKLSESKKEN